ncbi:MAG: hypothetical protein GKS00_20420 [Alphaproteobacteria bacterium]|nr:hypothetical protein [Alphaproteobacteria bacterium]
MDFEAAKLDPSAVFSIPEAVLTHPSLSDEQKIELLRRWEYDASELAVAEEEGMTGGESSMLGRVLRALESLTGGFDTEHSPPTKLGGLSRKDVQQD